eukprot:m51a1_g14565 putative major vault protein (1512) ;mRNA; f:1049567-1056001
MSSRKGQQQQQRAEGSGRARAVPAGGLYAECVEGTARPEVRGGTRPSDGVVRLPPFHYCYLMDTNKNVTWMIEGPQRYTLQDSEQVVLDVTRMLVVPPMHYALISNPVIRGPDGEVVRDEHGQARLRYGDFEVRFSRDVPFALHPGERVVDKVLPLRVVLQDQALRLEATRDFVDRFSKNADGTPVRRVAGEAWLFRGPATYLPQPEVEVTEELTASVLQPDEALVLRARVDIAASGPSSPARRAGEQWMLSAVGSFIPRVEEEVVRRVQAVVLTPTVALHLRACATFVDAYGVARKAGEEWLVTSRMSEKHIPDVNEAVVRMVPVTVLSSREYCVVVDPWDEAEKKNALGAKRLVRGPATFFLRPGESLENRVEEAYVLAASEALVVRAREEFVDGDDAATGTRRTPGSTWLVYGPSSYVPPTRVEVRSGRRALVAAEALGVCLLFWLPRAVNTSTAVGPAIPVALAFSPFDGTGGCSAAGVVVRDQVQWGIDWTELGPRLSVALTVRATNSVKVHITSLTIVEIVEEVCNSTWVGGYEECDGGEGCTEGCWCPPGYIKSFPRARSCTPSCETYYDAGSCQGSKLGCRWCNTTLTCQAPTVPCQPCEAQTVVGCHSGCRWCHSRSVCQPVGAQCPLCGSVSPQPACSLLDGCQWCYSLQQCTDSGACPRCYYEESSVACAGLDTHCEWCPESSQCTVSSITCTGCNEHTTYAACQGDTACAWCGSEMQCLSVNDTSLCPGCPESTRRRNECEDHTGCQWCQSSQRCTYKSYHEECVNCSALTHDSCQAGTMIGCYWCPSYGRCLDNDGRPGACPACADIVDPASCYGACEWCRSMGRCYEQSTCITCDVLTRVGCLSAPGCRWCNNSCYDSAFCPPDPPGPSLGSSSASAPEPLVACAQRSDCDSCAASRHCVWCNGDSCRDLDFGSDDGCTRQCPSKRTTRSPLLLQTGMYVLMGLFGLLIVVAIAAGPIYHVCKSREEYESYKRIGVPEGIPEFPAQPMPPSSEPLAVAVAAAARRPNPSTNAAAGDCTCPVLSPESYDPSTPPPCSPLRSRELQMRLARSPSTTTSVGSLSQSVQDLLDSALPPSPTSSTPLLDGLQLSKAAMYFGKETSQAPLDTALSDFFVLKNRSAKIRYFSFAMPPPNEKFGLVVNPRSGALKPHHSVRIDATITVYCTTKIALRVPIAVTSDERERGTYFIGVILESVLSWRLDYDELVVAGKPVGEGSYGVVYRGEWRGQEVAIKLLKSQGPDPALLNEFRREAMIMERLRSPYIVQLLGAVCLPGKMCLVTEYLPLGSVGGLMRARCRGSTPAGCPRTPEAWYALKIKFALECARGMRFLHASGILHRDLKPDNLMVTSLEPRAPIHCKLSDFGCTRDINEAGAKQFTRSVGTPVYMAPELLKIGASGCYSQSADVFSYGVCLYEIYTEREPYSDMPNITRMMDVVMFISQGRRLPLPPDCPECLVRLTHDCWCDDPARRPSFLDVVRRLEPIDADAIRGFELEAVAKKR